MVHHADGLVSTLYPLSFNEDGTEILIPAVSPDGKMLSPQEAIALYRKTGQSLGMFKTAADAEMAAGTIQAPKPGTTGASRKLPANKRKVTSEMPGPMRFPQEDA